MRPITSARTSYANSISINTVLRKTYLLLSLTLLFSAGAAWFAMISIAKPVGIVLLLVGMFGLYFLTTSLRNSRWGILAIFLYTGFMGYTLGPILSSIMHTLSNGPQVVMTSLGVTGVVFLGLSAHVLVSRKDYSYLGGFLSVTIMLAFLAAIASLFLHIPMLNMIVSFAFALLASGFILFTTSQIINGGEQNYIMATISLYIAIFNLFISLLRIFSAFAGGGSRD